MREIDTMKKSSTISPLWSPPYPSDQLFLLVMSADNEEPVTDALVQSLGTDAYAQDTGIASIAVLQMDDTTTTRMQIVPYTYSNSM